MIEKQPSRTRLADTIAIAKRIRRGTKRVGIQFWPKLAGAILTRFASTKTPLLPSPGSIRRVVFVCHGNIMRSAFAHAVWQALNDEATTTESALPVFSAGTDARFGNGAHPLASASALQLRISLAEHSATPLKDVELLVGDLLVGFDLENQVQLEVAASEVSGVQVLLLGDLECPGTLDAEIRDPWGSSETNTVATFARIESLIRILRSQLSSTQMH